MHRPRGLRGLRGLAVLLVVLVLACSGTARAAVPLVLPIGASCTVAESDTGGADATPSPVTVEIVENDEDNTVTAAFVNEFSAGTLALEKVLAGAGADEDYALDADFTVLLTCAVGEATNVVYSRSVVLGGGERVVLERPETPGEPVLLPLGSRCWGEETDAGGTPDDLQVLELVLTNTFDQASYTVDKVVDGAAADYAEGREFTVAVTCELPQNGGRTPLLTAEPHVITAGEPVVIDDLPVGAECWVAETDAGGATGTLLEHDGPAGAALVAGDGTTATEVTNTFDAADLVVRKRVVGGPAGPYSFEIACTTEQGPVELAAADAAFRLRDGESRTLSVPLGAACAVTETDVPEGVEVSFEGSDDDHDGRVVVAPSAEVVVVNTYPVVGAGGEGANGDDLPGTGGPSQWWVLLGVGLVLGGGLLLRWRRVAPA